LYIAVAALLSRLQSPFLLAMRLYFGIQLVQTGWSKMHDIPKFVTFFTSLNIPFPAFSAHFVSGVEFFGGLLLILGLATRLAGLFVAINMFVAYWTADPEALHAIFAFSDNPGKFYQADPFMFLFTGVIVLIFGAGYLSLDYLIAKRVKEQA
jgi:putative oxidoreductase